MEHITHAGSLEEQVQDLRKQLSAVIEQNTRLKASMQEESDKEEVEATAHKERKRSPSTKRIFPYRKKCKPSKTWCAIQPFEPPMQKQRSFNLKPSFTIVS